MKIKRETYSARESLIPLGKVEPKKRVFKNHIIWELSASEFEVCSIENEHLFFTASLSEAKQIINESGYTQLQDAFAVLDALRGSITGDYKKDLKYLHKRQRHCSEDLYNQAYQMDQQQ